MNINKGLEDSFKSVFAEDYLTQKLFKPTFIFPFIVVKWV